MREQTVDKRSMNIRQAHEEVPGIARHQGNAIRPRDVELHARGLARR